MLVGPGLLEVPGGELVEGDESVLRGNVNLGEERLDAVGDVESLVVVDEVLLLLEELLPLLHVVIRLAAVEEAVVLALPLLVVQPALQLGDGRVEGGRMVGFVLCLLLSHVPTGGSRG